MTATPDKRDDNLEGRNIYEIFNHQIAYEIRLQDAMEEDLLCPFHYFGITDLDIIADAGKSSEEKVENFRYLTSEERVENVMKQAEYFGYSGDRVKGLIFCSRIDEAKELSKKFNAKGWRTLVLSGSDSEEARAVAIERLAGEESEDALDYIISVDIFSEKYHCEMDEHCMENVINMMTNEFPTSAAKKTYAQCVFLKKEQDDYGISDVYGKMLENPEFCAILEELVDFGISRYKVNYSYHYQDTNLVLYQKYTYEDACRLLNWERNEVPLNIGGYKYDKKTKTFPIFINYDKQDNISDTTKYEDHFVAENRLIAISKSGRSMDSEDVQNFLNATERGIDVQLFVRKNKDDKISKEFYYLGRVIATGNAKQFVMPNTDKTAVEIEWELETPVREDIYQYIVNE